MRRHIKTLNLLEFKRGQLFKTQTFKVRSLKLRIDASCSPEIAIALLEKTEAKCSPRDPRHPHSVVVLITLVLIALDFQERDQQAQTPQRQSTSTGLWTCAKRGLQSPQRQSVEELR